MLINEKLEAFFTENEAHLDEDDDSRFLFAFSGDLKQAPNEAQFVVNGQVGNIAEALYQTALKYPDVASIICDVARKL